MKAKKIISGLAVLGVCILLTVLIHSYVPVGTGMMRNVLRNTLYGAIWLPAFAHFFIIKRPS